MCAREIEIDREVERERESERGKREREKYVKESELMFSTC